MKTSHKVEIQLVWESADTGLCLQITEGAQVTRIPMVEDGRRFLDKWDLIERVNDEIEVRVADLSSELVEILFENAEEQN